MEDEYDDDPVKKKMKMKMKMMIGFECSKSESNHVPLPWLMLPYPLDDPPDINTHHLYCLHCSNQNQNQNENDDKFPFPNCLENNICHRLYLPEISDTRFHGIVNCPRWLFALCRGSKSSPFLFNPVTRGRINLPPLPLPTPWINCPDHHYDNDNDDTDDDDDDDDDDDPLGPQYYIPSISLVAISSDPSSSSSSSSLEIMVIHGWDRRLAFCHPGDVHWTPVLTRDRQGGGGGGGHPCTKILALTHANDKFYAIDYENNLIICDARASPSTATLLTSLPNNPKKKYIKYFLTVSHQQLFLIVRVGGLGFRLFKLIQDDDDEDLKKRNKEKERKKKAKEDKNKLREQEEIKLRQQEEEGLGADELWLLRLRMMDINDKEEEEEEDEEEEEQVKWLRMHTIGQWAIFVCEQNLLLVPASTSTSDSYLCAPNCIYYYEFFGETNYPNESCVKLLQFSLEKNRWGKMIHCSPLQPIQLWEPFFLQPTQPVDDEMSHETQL